MIWSISSGGSVMRAACWWCCCSEDMIVWIEWFDLAERNVVLTGIILTIRMRDDRGCCPIDRLYVLEPRSCGGVQYHDGRSAVFIVTTLMASTRL